jgi:CBS domain-containing protein
MKCQDVMKGTVHCAQREDTVQSAATTMRDKQIGFLPVCDGDQVVGALTDRDITIRLATTNRSASDAKVREIMTEEVVCCRPEDDLAEAERLMATRQKSRIVVTDENGTLRGVISLSDVAARDTATRAAVTLKNVATREAHH